MSGLLRAVCEHEAAHAVVAAHHGVRVLEVRASAQGQGFTAHEGATDPRVSAAITAAGDAWQRHLSGLPYEDLACVDLAVFEREHGLAALWGAQHEARAILTRRRAAVEALADRLARDHVVRFP
ncbi:hypothetical protein [Streptomyces phaeochromogenes]